MDPSSLILIAVAAVAILAATGAFTIAYRRSHGSAPRPIPGPTSDAGKTTPPPTETAIRAREDEALQPKAKEVPTRVTIVQAQRIVEVSPEEGGVTRRQFFNRAITATFGSFLALQGLYYLAFFWPRLTGGFGSKVDAGPVKDIKAQLAQTAGSVTPFVVSEARAYVVPITDEQLKGSQFNQPGLAAAGLMAMWWRCVHLGCRAPWCAPSAGFECPCHGSKYNLVGEYQAGPAPRNLDRFAVEVTADGRLIIDTGNIVQTPRAPAHTVPYPQGPSCIAL